MIDLVELKIALETDPRYDNAVRTGKNRELLALFAADTTGLTFLKVGPEDVMDAIGDGVRGLTAEQREILLLFTSGEAVDFRKVATRTEIRQVFDSKAAVLARLQAVGSRTATFGDAFGDSPVSLRDLWAVLRDIPKSYMATKLAEG